MSITLRQKNIVNPYPEAFADINSYDDPTLPPNGGANGEDYDYNSERNKWILEGIHDCYLTYGYFPRIGMVLKQLGPLNVENNVVTLQDVMAYAALYPQNGVVISSPIFSVPTNAIEDSDEARQNSARENAPLGLVPLSNDQSLKALRDVAQIIIEKGTIEKFYSITTPEVQRPSNQLLFQALATNNFSSLAEESQRLYTPILQSALVTIAPIVDDLRLKAIRKTFKNDPDRPLLLPKSEQQTQAEIYLNKQPTGIDFTEWSANITPDAEKKIVYYDPTSRQLYYCVRTNSQDPDAFDVSKRLSDQAQENNVRNFKREALKAMVVFSERFFESDQQIEDNLRFVNFEARYGDAFRPPLPAGYGFWLIAAIVPLSVITGFPENLAEDSSDNLLLKTNPSPLQTSRSLIENLHPRKRFAHKIRDMEQYVSEMLKVLNFYNDKLYEEGVEYHVLNKLNIEREILRVEQFLPLLYQMATSVGVSLTPEDYIEIHLSDTYDILYFNINGTSYFQNLGLDPKTLLPPKSDITIDVVLREDGTPEIEAKNRSELQAYENIFSNLSPTTLAYLFNSKKISRLAQKLESENVPPWSDFFMTYTYPNPNKNSFDVVRDQQRQLQKETVTTGASTQTPKQQQATLAGTKGQDVKGFKTAKDVQKILQRRSKTQQQMYMLVRNSTRKCNTGFARATQTLMDGYMAFAKGRPSDMVSFVVHTIRNDVIDLLVATNRTSPETAGNIRRDIDTANAYGRDPDLIRREIEKYVNDQISGCLDLIGDIVIDTVIDPAVKPSSKGMAGPVKKYWKDAIKPPGSLRIPKTPTSNFFGAWGKKLKELTLKMIEQLILSILGDVISSLLGCGPSLPNTAPTKMPGSSNASFGAIRINNVADDNSINLLEIAKTLSMVNTSVFLDDEGNKQISTSPPTLEQLRQLNDDVSDFLTKSEAVALLDGNLSPLTMAAIEEMINRGSYSVPSTGIIIESLKTDKQYMAQFQESLKRDDVKYATLGLNIELIRMYFSAIGDESLDTEDLLEDLDPRAAFCAKYSVSDDSPLLELGISQAQLNAQVDNEVNKKVDKIKNLCDMFAYDGFAWQQDVIDFFDQFPVASSYNNLLNAISRASQEAQKALLEAMKAQQDSTQNRKPEQLGIEQTEFYEFCQENFGTERLSPIPSVQRPKIFQWSIGDVDSGQISFTLARDAANWTYQDSETYKFWFTNPLSPSNNPRSNLEGEPTYSIVGLADQAGRIAVDSFAATPAIAAEMININNQLSGDIRPSDTYKIRSRGQNEFYSIINADATITGLLSAFWASEIGVRRLQALRETLGNPSFLPGGPRCKTNKSKAIAEAAYFGIETRVVNFLLNVGPLMRAFPGWMTPDFLNVVSTYLSQKIYKDWADKNILNVYVSALGDIDTNYSNGPTNKEGFNMEINQLTPSRAQLSYIVNQILSTFFSRLGKGRAYSYPGTNFFDPESQWTTEGVYMRSVLADYKTLAYAYRSATWKFPGGFGEEPFTVNLFDEMRGRGLDNIIPSISAYNPNTDTSWETSKALYYLPLPLITAMQVIYFDHTVNINAKWPQFRFNTGRQVALADDALLSAVNEENITIFSNPYNGYPVTIERQRYYSREEIIQRIIDLQAQRNRIHELESLFGAVALYEEDYENHAYQHTLGGDYLDKKVEEFRDFFNTLYQLVGPRYMAKYKTQESRDIEQRKVLQQYYVTDYPETFVAGGDSSSIGWIRQRAWYERARLLGYAPDDEYDNSLLYEWANGEEDPRMTVEETDDNGEITRRRMNDEELKKLKGFRTTCLEANSFNNAEGWHFNNSQFMAAFWQEDFNEVRDAHWAAKVTNYGHDQMTEEGQHLMGFVYTVFGVVLEALFNPSVSPIGIVTSWLLGLGEEIYNYFDDFDKYFDPNENDSLKWLRNPPVTRLGDTDLAATLDFQQDIIAAAKKLSGHKGSATSPGTLDKAVIANLYYELAWRSQTQKENSDPLNPDSELSLLLDYINESDQAEFYGTALPAYLTMQHIELAYATEGDDNNVLQANHLSRQAFPSLLSLQDQLAQLRQHPLYIRRDEYTQMRARVTNAVDEIVSLVDKFKEDYNQNNEWGDLINQISKAITDEGEDGLQSFVSLTIDANLDLFNDDVNDAWEGHRDRAVEYLRDEIDDPLWWRDNNDTPGYSELLALRERVFGQSYADHRNGETLDFGGFDDEGFYRSPTVGGLIFEVMDGISDLHRLYADITNDTSANPRTYVGVDYDRDGWDDGDPVDTTTRARTWPMSVWLDAFDADIGNLVAQITWREF